MRKKWSFLCIVVCVIVSLACSLTGGTTPNAPTPASTPVASSPTAAPSPTSVPPTVPPTATAVPPVATALPVDLGTGFRQWAISAAASSEYGDPNWGAAQATGKPDTAACGDFASAWAAFDGGGVEWLELAYDVPVLPTQVHIIQTFNPSQVVKVELIDTVSGYHEIYVATPQAVDECPYTLSIPVDVDYQVAGLRITVDHSALGLGRNQIDAVELIGVPDRPVIPEATTAADVLWQVGSTSDALADLSFTTFGGIDATDTAVYIADAYNSVYVFDLEGNYQGQLAQGEIGYVVDVKVGPSGSVYLAEAGFRQVVMFDAAGALLGAFGGLGTGDGEFSGDSPAALAVGLDGSVYALDIGDAGTRVQVFTPEGDFIRSFSIEAELGAKAMDVGPDGTLFLTGAGGYILELTPDDGRVIQRLGQEALGDAFPQMMSVDDASNFYVVTWGPPGAVKLDAQGQLLETIGVEATNDGVTGWPAGEFLFPVGIAVTGDGRYLFIGDGYGEFAFLTAYRYP